MANKIKEIREFFSGIISSLSYSDIKEDAASYSLNIDSVTKDGVLKGIPGNKEFVLSETIDTPLAITVENSDRKHDLIYYESISGEMKLIKDLYGSQELGSPDGASGVGIVPESIEKISNSIFVGYGSSDTPKVVYKTKNNPFNPDTQDDSNWISEKATLDHSILNSSFTADRFIMISETKNQAVGIRYDHKDVYFIHFNASETEHANGGYWDMTGLSKIHLGASNAGLNLLVGGACDICEATELLPPLPMIIIS